MRIAFLGPPGSGKGTYASRIAPKLGILHVSTGNILREAAAKKTPLGVEADKYMKAGKPVPDHIMVKIIIERLTQPDCEKGFIFDCPYNLYQAKEIDSDERTKIELVINLRMLKEILIEKSLARRVCENCGDIYNIADIKKGNIHMPPMLPKKEGVCDKCGGPLIQRKDDKLEVIEERLRIYNQRAEPMVKYYKDRKVLKNVDVIGPPEVMVPIIKEVIEKS